MGGSKAERQRRVRRVLELSTLGMTIPQISAQMRAEGFKAGERTVWSDLNGVEAQEYIGEILRRQFADISMAPLRLRLKYRGKILDRLLSSKIVRKVEREVLHYDVEDFLNRMVEEKKIMEKNR